MKQTQSRFVVFIAAVMTISMVLAASAPGAYAAPTLKSAQSGLLFQMPNSKKPDRKINPVDFQLTMNKLWEDHITWTRMYIVSFVAGLPDVNAAAQRLLQNQVDIGNAIKPFYGEAAGDQLTALLRDHILIAVDLLSAAKAGNTAGFEAAKIHWYDNANQIAIFLNSANPKNWSLADMQAMMKSHLDLTLAEATARLTGDWAGDVVAYDNVHNEILQMSHMLSTGIIAQFPKKFK